MVRRLSKVTRPLVIFLFIFLYLFLYFFLKLLLLGWFPLKVSDPVSITDSNFNLRTELDYERLKYANLSTSHHICTYGLPHACRTHTKYIYFCINLYNTFCCYYIFHLYMYIYFSWICIKRVECLKINWQWDDGTDDQAYVMGSPLTYLKCKKLLSQVLIINGRNNYTETSEDKT